MMVTMLGLHWKGNDLLSSNAGSEFQPYTHFLSQYPCPTFPFSLIPVTNCLLPPLSSRSRYFCVILSHSRLLHNKLNLTVAASSRLNFHHCLFTSYRFVYLIHYFTFQNYLKQSIYELFF